MNNPSEKWTDLEKYVYGEHKSSCMLEAGGYACTCGKQEAAAELAAYKEIAWHRDELQKENAALRAETNHRFVVCTYCGWRLDYESEKREAARESANAHALECEKDPRNIENAALRARVGELEQELDELRNIVAAQIVEWKYRVENQPMPTDRLIGIDMCADELSAALAKGAK